MEMHSTGFRERAGCAKGCLGGSGSSLAVFVVAIRDGLGKCTGGEAAVFFCVQEPALCPTSEQMRTFQCDLAASPSFWIHNTMERDRGKK